MNDAQKKYLESLGQESGSHGEAIAKDDLRIVLSVVDELWDEMFKGFPTGVEAVDRIYSVVRYSILRDMSIGVRKFGKVASGSDRCLFREVEFDGRRFREYDFYGVIYAYPVDRPDLKMGWQD